MAAPLTAVVITKNEAAHIGACLASLQWVDEVLVLDSHSTDNTVQLAAAYPNVRVIVTEWLGYSATKQKGVDAARHDWILWVDADERVTPELAAELQALAHQPGITCYDVARRTYFMGQWIRHTGWYPGRVKRYFDRRHCRLNGAVLHEEVELLQGGLGQLRHDLLHHSYTSLYQYFDKMNAYGRAGALELQRRGRRASLWQLLANPTMTFFKFYLFKQGFRDGAAGFIISVGSAFSNFIKYVNFYYLQRQGGQH